MTDYENYSVACKNCGHQGTLVLAEQDGELAAAWVGFWIEEVVACGISTPRVHCDGCGGVEIKIGLETQRGSDGPA